MAAQNRGCWRRVFGKRLHWSMHMGRLLPKGVGHALVPPCIPPSEADLEWLRSDAAKRRDQ